MTQSMEKVVEEYLTEDLDERLSCYGLEVGYEEEDLFISITYLDGERPPFVGSSLEEVLDYESFSLEGSLNPDDNGTRSISYSFELETA